MVGPGRMKLLGIDPGLSGALAILCGDEVLLVEDMPVHSIVTGRKTRVELDVPSLRQLLTAQPIDHVVIEKVASRPGQGVSSMFKFGHCAGAVYGLVVGLQLPCSFVLPQLWQRAAGCGPSPDAARQRAAQLYPAIAPQLARKRNAGRADAILIARHGLQLLARAAPPIQVPPASPLRAAQCPAA
jgi:crossover junction endodeoxyribonuclease RuvC